MKRAINFKAAEFSQTEREAIISPSSHVNGSELFKSVTGLSFRLSALLVLKLSRNYSLRELNGEQRKFEAETLVCFNYWFAKLNIFVDQT